MRAGRPRRCRVRIRPGSGAIEFSLHRALRHRADGRGATVCGITGTAASGPLSCSKKAMLGESNLRLREAVRDARRVLSSTGSARIDAIAFSGGAANVGSTLYVTVLYDTENGQLHAFTSAIPFRDSFAASMGEDCFAGRPCRRCRRRRRRDFGVATRKPSSISIIRRAARQQRVLFDAYDTGSTFTCRQENVGRLAYPMPGHADDRAFRTCRRSTGRSTFRSCPPSPAPTA